MRRWICLLLMTAMLFAVAGCGLIFDRDRDNVGDNIEGSDDPVNEIGADDDQGDEPLIEGDFYALDSILDLALHFKELGCNFFDTEADYLFLGPDTVEGVKAEHVRIVTGGSEIDFWLDDSGKLIKTVFNGEEYPEEAGEQALVSFFSLLDLFFQQQNWDDSWNDAERSIVSRNLGAGAVQVTRLDWSPSWLQFNLEIEIAEIAGRNLVIRFWQVTDDGEDAGGWFLHRVIPR